MCAQYSSTQVGNFVPIIMVRLISVNDEKIHHFDETDCQNFLAVMIEIVRRLSIEQAYNKNSYYELDFPSTEIHAISL